MQSELFVAVLSFVGTLVGTVSGIVASSRLMGYRIDQLEKKVDKHNNMIERMYAVERRLSLLEQRADKED